MRIGIVCYPTFGGSGVLATELGKALAQKGHQVHFITYQQPVRLNVFVPNIFYHEVSAGLLHRPFKLNAFLEQPLHRVLSFNFLLHLVALLRSCH